MSVIVDILNESNNPLPKYATDGSSGMDLYAFLDNDIIIEPGTICVIPTGIYISIKQGNVEAQVRSRSGLAIKRVFVINSPGTVDNDYRGPIKVILYNAGDKPITVGNGDRIAQMVFVPILRATLNQVDSFNDLDETSRGVGGFGSTGMR